MSSSLYYEPAEPKEPQYLGYRLRFVIARRLWDHDGSLNSEKTLLTRTDVPWLRGITDASAKEIREEAEKLIKLIEKNEHGAFVWLDG